MHKFPERYVGQVDLNILIGQKCSLSVVCIKDKYCINLVKIRSQSVDLVALQNFKQKEHLKMTLRDTVLVHRILQSKLADHV